MQRIILTSNFYNFQNSSVHYWLENGATPEKLVLGIPFYGKSFTLINPNKNKIGALSSGAFKGPYSKIIGHLGYNELCEMQMQGGWKAFYRTDQKVPFTYKGDQWVGYDNPR